MAGPQAQPRLAANVVGCSTGRSSEAGVNWQLAGGGDTGQQYQQSSSAKQHALLRPVVLHVYNPGTSAHSSGSPYTQPSLSATHSSWAGSSTIRQPVVRPFSVAATCAGGAGDNRSFATEQPKHTDQATRQLMSFGVCLVSPPQPSITSP